VQKTDQIARLFHLFVTGDGFIVLLALLISIATSAAAQPSLAFAPAPEPSMTKKTFLAAYGNLLFSADGSNSSLTDNTLETVGLQYEKTTIDAASEVHLEKESKAGQRDSFQFVHESLSASSQSNASFSLQAGYGQIWDDKSMLQKIVCDRQDPGCAYVSANFSF
jgi:hypothetical protein